MLNSGNSGSYHDGPIDLGITKLQVSGDFNKSPVLYLRRRRYTDFKRFKAASYTSDSGHDKIILNRSEKEFQPVDDGSIYPNHESQSRTGEVQWSMYREYKQRRTKWLRDMELIVDGTSVNDIT
jgi:hypothetical protein